MDVVIEIIKYRTYQTQQHIKCRRIKKNQKLISK